MWKIVTETVGITKTIEEQRSVELNARISDERRPEAGLQTQILLQCELSQKGMQPRRDVAQRFRNPFQSLQNNFCRGNHRRDGAVDTASELKFDDEDKWVQLSKTKYSLRPQLKGHGAALARDELSSLPSGNLTADGKSQDVARARQNYLTSPIESKQRMSVVLKRVQKRVDRTNITQRVENDCDYSDRKLAFEEAMLSGSVTPERRSMPCRRPGLL